MIDNFQQVKWLLKFDSEDDFYFCQIIKRKKENKELGSNSYVVKTYFIKSVDELEFYQGEMICLAEYHNARVCINLNRRNFERTCLHALKKLTDQILNKDYRSARKAYNSVCGMYSAEEDRNWIVDIDVKDDEFVGEVVAFIDQLQPEGSKLIATIETKNGVHLITRPFNLQRFKETYPYIEVHKNNPTILYIP